MKIKLLYNLWGILKFFFWGIALQSIFTFVVLASEVPEVSEAKSIYTLDTTEGVEDITVTGTVKDESGEPLPGVAVILKGTTTGTVSDMEGKYSIRVPEKSTLVFSFIGYIPQEVVIDGRKVINLTMEPDVTSLEEVIIVGYGEQKKASVVGSISQTKGEDLLRVGGVNTVSEALQGLIPGVVAISRNSKPGSDAASLNIRGRLSWGNNQPLTLVDGVERDINDVDPNEIENISVLKDASATAVYGVRGANGVILLTTRRGKKGKPKINFSANFGFKQPTAKVNYADYVSTMERYNEAAINDKLWDQLIPESEIEAWRQNIDQAGPYNQYFPQIDWWDELTNDFGYQQRYNINVRGGTKFVKYFTSLGYLNDGDIYHTESNPDFDPSFGYKRYNWRSNLDFSLTKTTQFSVSFSGKFGYRNQPGYRINGQGEDGFGQPQFMNKIYTSPTNLFPLRYEDGEWGESSAGDHNMLVQMNEGGQRIYKYYEGFYDASLNQDLSFITEGLSFKAKLSYTSSSDYQSRILRTGVGGALSGIDIIRYSREYDYSNPVEGQDGAIGYPMISETRWPDNATQKGIITANYDVINGYSQWLYYEFSTDYNKKIGRHDISGLLLMNRQINISNGQGANVPFPRYREDWVARATYGYDNRYLFEVNGALPVQKSLLPAKGLAFSPLTHLAGCFLKKNSLMTLQVMCLAT
jgi:TonB-linked SusC/RagA family outer membrane protein